MFTPQEISNTIREEIESRRISPAKLLRDCEINRNAFTNMEKRGTYPGIETIFKIADYLNCSVDYLLGRTDNPESHLLSAAPSDAAPSTAQQLMDTFSQLSKGDQLILLGEAMNLLETRNSTSVAADGEAPGKHSPSSGTGGHAEANEKEKPA